MTLADAHIVEDVERRARQSAGTSAGAIYKLVTAVIREQAPPRVGTLVDVGCGAGTLAGQLSQRCDRYIGLDVVRYDDLPATVEFHQADLDAPHWPIEDATGNVVVAVETIEHLENPRAFFREMRRVARPGGLIVVTTPNQLSLLSKATLLTRNCFNAFQERPGLYPAHRTALLEIDLIRIARECDLRDIATRFTNRGRVPGTAWHWPSGIPGFRGRAFSDNVLLHARRAPEEAP